MACMVGQLAMDNGSFDELREWVQSHADEARSAASFSGVVDAFGASPKLDPRQQRSLKLAKAVAAYARERLSSRGSGANK
jgi:hypothetical protein